MEEVKGSADSAAEASDHRPGSVLHGRRILLVEDAALIALDAESILQASGVEVIGPAGRLKTALELAKNADLDGAILDIDLNGTPVWEVADVLKQRGIPFGFATGFEAAIVLPDRFAGSLILGKPYNPHELTSLLLRMLQHGVGK